MAKRKIIIGEYDTAANGWTLASCQLSAAVQKTNDVDNPGGDGSLDLSTYLTDGIPRYKDRSLTVTLECSEGTRKDRQAKIRHMVNLLDGMREDIRLPDDEGYHINGRLHVVPKYNDLAHAAVTVTAVCKPWKFADEETEVALTASTTAQIVELLNEGRRAVVPTLTVKGTNASIQLTYGESTLSVSAGAYQWPDLLLTPGAHELTYSGSGSLTVTYREAVLE